MHLKTLLLPLSLCVFLTTAANKCFSESNNSSTIRIGVIQSLTGIAAEDGKTVVQALQLAADDINSKNQAKVELVVEDDGTQPKNTVTAFERLSSLDVPVIIGATWDFTTNAIMALSARKGLVIFNTSTLMESLLLSDSKGYGFINAVSAKGEASAFERFLEKHTIKNMVIVFANNSWGETQLKVYKEIASKHHVKILDELRSTSFDANEWNIYATRVKQKNSDLVLLLLNKDDLELFLKKAAALEIKSSFFASKNLYDAFRNSSSKELYSGVCFTYPMEQLRRESDFRTRYREKFGEEARIYADNTYDALFIIVKAIQESQKHDVSLRDAMRSIRYEGVVGNYEFSETNSFSTGNSSLVCINNGEAQLPSN